MQNRHRARHGIRIADDLWQAIAIRAKQERRSRTAWAQAVLDAAAAGRLLAVPHRLMRRLMRQAAREGVSYREFTAELLEESLALRERRGRR